MKTRARSSRFSRAVRTAILLVSAAAAVSASPSTTSLPSAKTPLCYCHCEQMNGGKQCTKMCELPRYENRWWAKTCRPKSAMGPSTSAPASDSGSRKTNRTEEARK
ncbi:MAG: hypothetical protein LAO19_01710 [Acidobacteriia bacterium]|nr:hypothetical protein [Terriglobia bacterium]